MCRYVQERNNNNNRLISTNSGHIIPMWILK
jgi:hypothetical protein